MPPTTTIASRFWVCEPILVDKAAGRQEGREGRTAQGQGSQVDP